MLRPLIGNKFKKKHIFETLWLIIMHWTKVSVVQMRHFLKIDTESDVREDIVHSSIVEAEIESEMTEFELEDDLRNNIFDGKFSQMVIDYN